MKQVDAGAEFNGTLLKIQGYFPGVKQNQSLSRRWAEFLFLDKLRACAAILPLRRHVADQSASSHQL